MTHLDLFSGIGGFALGLQRVGFRTVAFCETDEKCRLVLQKNFPDVPIFDDVRTLARRTSDNMHIDGDFAECSIHTGEDFGDCACVGTDELLDRVGGIDVITAGFPCQDISVGHTWSEAKGIDGDRSSLWWEASRIIGEVQPSWVIIENVSALRSRGLERVLCALDTLGYVGEWHCIPASAVGADHQRDRVFVVANNQGKRVEGLRAERLKEFRALAQPLLSVRNGDGKWKVEPDLRRSPYGLSSRLDGRIATWGDRLHMLGNAVVPQVVQFIGTAIAEQA